ncbi:MAG: virulence protein RhuM/Fic/DOC family protein [Muribaculaceae bacterium]|nr:virulence protein RhuM/Fic/DOC family protein [Muribaculaceae bacterium]
MDEKIIIYQSPDGSNMLDVRLEDDTVWLSQAQMAMLFDKDRTVISRHIRNVFKEKELNEKEVCAKFAHTSSHGSLVGKTQTQIITFYNLDVIISVGYRVKSQRGTQFRIWANKILKDYIVRGYAVNEKRIKEVENKYDELKNVVRLIRRTVTNQESITANEGEGLLSVITDYVYALDTLDRYDYQQLKIQHTTAKETFRATYENAMETIAMLKEKFGTSPLFGNEKDESFRSSIGQIYQTFDGRDLYPSIEEKAAMLLYLVTKNHSFSDGNKRIAATLFLWFMHNNGILYNADATKRIADNTLVALTLMIAESRTEEKDTMVKVVVNLINRDNE